MNNNTDTNVFIDIILDGKYFFPASIRYPEGSIVICDRCQKQKLVSCIGCGDLDLCLPCADLVAQGKSNIFPNIYRSEK
jgi:hypothetical protein